MPITRLDTWLSLLLAAMLVASLPSSHPLPAPRTTAGACADLPVVTLDAGWGFRTDPDDAGVAERWYAPETSYASWKDLAPGEPWEYSGIEYDGVAWYRTTIKMPHWATVYLGFGPADDVGTLWVNGVRAMEWRLGQRGPAFLDLSPFAQSGDDVDLAVRVEDYGGYGGIKGPARLSPQPRGAMTDAEHMVWLAERHPDWPMPGWVHGDPLAWTMTALPGATSEALVRSDGAVAPWATAPTVEMWLYDPVTDELTVVSERDVDFSLHSGHLPLPRWEWETTDITVENTLFQDVTERATNWQITVGNSGEKRRELRLLMVVRPFGVDRSMAPICSVEAQGTSRLWVDGNPFLTGKKPPHEVGLGSLADVMSAAIRGHVPLTSTEVNDPSGVAAAVWAYSLSLDAGGSDILRFAFPSLPGEDFPAIPASAETQLAHAAAQWDQAVRQVEIDIPDDFIRQGVRASTGYLLLSIGPQGPHPGPLMHDSMWVRDAAYIGLALLQLGYADVVRAYIPHIVASQEPDGRIPPIQGSDIPWESDQWDAQGQFIFLVTTYYRYTGDLDGLRDWYPALREAVEFLVELRAAYDHPSDATQGLLPPSKSAEDLGPDDQHYYWDNLWAVAGLEEAAYAARELGRTEDARWMEGEAEALRAAILDSVAAVMGSEAAYIPGAVEEVESSAMARGSVPALWPIKVIAPEAPLVQRSFDQYYERWIAPDQGGFRHRQGQFWPYGGLELAHAYLRLGRKAIVHEILGWVLSNQTLPGTFAWAEQVDPETGGFSGGDMPHAWAAASYSTLVREMIVSENEGALELFTGVPAWWLSAEQTIVYRGAPTQFGVLDLQTESTVQQTDAGWEGVLTLTLSGAMPPEGFRWRMPEIPAAVDGPVGTAVADGVLLVPAGGGTVHLSFVTD